MMVPLHFAVQRTYSDDPLTPGSRTADLTGQYRGGYQFDGSNCHSVMDLATSKIVMSQCADDWFEEHPVSTYTREVRTITIPMDGGMSSIATMINIVNGSNTIASSKAFWWAYPVKLVQPAASSSMDTLQASASASPSNTLPAPTGAPTTDPVQDNAAGNNETSPQKGLATTTKIAIGVAVPLLALLVAAAAFFFLRRRKRRTAQAGTKPEEEVDSTTDWIGPEMDGSAQINEASGAPRPNPELDGVVRIGEVFGDTVQKPELDSAHINEVSGDTDHVPELGAGTETTPFSGPTELDANKGNLPSSGPHELDGGNHWTSELDANSGRKEMGDRYR